MRRGCYLQLVETEISPVLDGMDGWSCKIVQDGFLCQNLRRGILNDKSAECGSACVKTSLVR